MTDALDAVKGRLHRDHADLDGWSLLQLALKAEIFSDCLPSGDGEGTRGNAHRVAGVLASMAAARSHETSWARADIVSLATRCLSRAEEHDEAASVFAKFDPPHVWQVERDSGGGEHGRTAGLRFVFAR